jgi:integrase-like protein
VPRVTLPREREKAGRDRWLSADELAQLYIELPADWVPLFQLLASTGLRIGEALGLTWQDVRFAERTVRVRGHGVETTKGTGAWCRWGRRWHARWPSIGRLSWRGQMTLSSRAPYPRKLLSDCSPEWRNGSAGRIRWYTISAAPLRFMRWRAASPWPAFSGGLATGPRQ